MPVRNCSPVFGPVSWQSSKTSLMQKHTQPQPPPPPKNPQPKICIPRGILSVAFAFLMFCVAVSALLLFMSAQANSVLLFSPSCRLFWISPVLGSASLLLCVLWHAQVFSSVSLWVSLFLFSVFRSVKMRCWTKLFLCVSLDYFFSCMFSLSNGFQQLDGLRNTFVQTTQLVIAYYDKLSNSFVEVWYLSQCQLHT